MSAMDDAVSTLASMLADLSADGEGTKEYWADIAQSMMIRLLPELSEAVMEHLIENITDARILQAAKDATDADHHEAAQAVIALYFKEN